MAFSPRLLGFAMPLTILMWTGCGGDSRSAQQRAEVQELHRQAEIARQIESTSALVVRVVGQVGNELFEILRVNGVSQPSDRLFDRAGFAQAVGSIEKANDSVVLVVPAGGFEGYADSNVVRLLATNGLSSVRVLVERWGMRFPLPEDVREAPESRTSVPKSSTGAQ